MEILGSMCESFCVAPMLKSGHFCFFTVVFFFSGESLILQRLHIIIHRANQFDRTNLQRKDKCK